MSNDAMKMEDKRIAENAAKVDAVVSKSSSTVLGLLKHTLYVGMEAIGLSYAIAIGPTLWQNTKPMLESITKLGFEKGWEAGPKAWASAPAGALGAGIMGRVTSHFVQAGIETIYGKVGPNGKMVAEAMGAFVAVGLQVGVFAGKGLAALATPAGISALAVYAVATAATTLAIKLVETPLKALTNYGSRALS